MGASQKRALMKTLTWRLISIVITFFLAWTVTGSMSIGAVIGSADAGIKMFLYYLHERAWHAWKKKQTKGATNDHQTEYH